MRLVTVKRPVAGIVGDHVERTDRADRHIDGDFRPLRALRHPAAVGAAHGEAVPVQVDRVIGHREIAHTDPDFIA